MIFQRRSYLTILYRHSPSQADVAVFEGLGKAPNSQFAHAHRWYSHISSFGAAKSKFPGAKAAPPPKVEVKEEDDDEVDLFGSSDDEEEVCYFYPFFMIQDKLCMMLLKLIGVV